MNAAPLICSDTMDSVPTGEVAKADSSPARYVVARLVIGVLLMFAGLDKVVAAQPILIASTWVIPIAAATVWGLIELILGWFVLSFVASRWLRIVLKGMFVLFALVLLLEWSRGYDPSVGRRGQSQSSSLLKSVVPTCLTVAVQVHSTQHV